MICINGLWAHLFSYTDIGHIGYTKSWFYLSRYMLLNCSICCLLIYMVVIRIGQRQEDVLAFYGHDWWLRGSLLMIPSLVTLGIKSRGLIARFIEHSPLYLSVISTIVLLALVVTHSSLHIDQERLILLLVHHSAVVLLNPSVIDRFLCTRSTPTAVPEASGRSMGQWAIVSGPGQRPSWPQHVPSRYKSFSLTLTHERKI